MSSPGLLPGADQPPPQQQDPLFGQPVVDPNVLKMREMLAQQMMQQGQGGPPISSWTQVADKALSPLMGIMMQKRVAEQQAQLQKAAMPEFAAALKSGDPMGAFAKSQNPLVQQMLLQAMPDWMKQQALIQAHVSEASQMIGPHVAEANAMIAPKVAEANALIAPKVAETNALAGPQAAASAQKTKADAEAGLATKLKELAAGQAATYAGQAETARHNKAMEGGGGGGGGGTPVISTKADFDKLPSGTVYRESDGNTYRKP